MTETEKAGVRAWTRSERYDADRLAFLTYTTGINNQLACLCAPDVMSEEQIAQALQMIRNDALSMMEWGAHLTKMVIGLAMVATKENSDEKRTDGQ